ncbi:diacylglycerol kinase family protein [Novosphingobium colocasiae]|uniref:diacylglycerol kinase family protein n=1 Tax=Novosphingobium colocasiae TaxID=1256513 RepID=UPI0035B1C356
MDHTRIWLVRNPASGSNDDDGCAALKQAFADAGLGVEREILFPDEPAPAPDRLEDGAVDILAVFAGDGTTHAVLGAVQGWGGVVLVLPGGTQNLLSKRLHGDVPPDEIVGRVGRGEARRIRPPVLRTRHGDGYADMLAGPGAVWSDVREAMREANLMELVSTTTEAISRTAQGPRVICDGVDGGRADGYAAINVTPLDAGLETNGYYADTLGDLAGQGLAMLGRNFREGPHDELGHHRTLHLRSTTGEPMELLIDGEPFDGAAEEVVELAPSRVDMLATCPQAGPAS